MKKLMFALAAATLAVSPALAGETNLPTQTVKIRVSTAGLNLANSRDVAKLHARVQRAIAEACTPGGVYRAFQVTDETCTGQMATDSQQVVSRLTQDAAKNQMAEF